MPSINTCLISQSHCNYVSTSWGVVPAYPISYKPLHMLGGNVSLSAPECVLYLDLFSLSFLSKIDDSNSHDTRLAMASSRDEQADDFNSSDIEYEHPPPDPFGSAGA